VEGSDEKEMSSAREEEKESDAEMRSDRASLPHRPSSALAAAEPISNPKPRKHTFPWPLGSVASRILE
jgi:hypothetical protein